MVLQVHFVYRFLNDVGPQLRGNSFDARVEPEMLLNGQEWEDSVLLRAVTDKLSGFLELPLNVEPSNRDLTSSWKHIACKALKCCRLSCAVDAEQCKALTVVKSK